MDLNTKGFIKKKVSLVLKSIVLLACFIIYMFPFGMVVINSFKTKRDIIKEMCIRDRYCSPSSLPGKKTYDRAYEVLQRQPDQNQGGQSGCLFR